MTRKIAVGQAGGPTAVINDTLAGVIYESRLRGLNLTGLRNGFEGGGLNPFIPGNRVDLTNLSDAEILAIRGIPGAYLGTTRLKLKPGKDDDQIKQIRDNLDSSGIECVFYIGGNDSAGVIRAEGKGIHLTKTEDNDLPENDHTPGWGSACLANSLMLRALNHDMSGFNPKVKNKDRIVYSTAPVIVYQTQGRDTGWLALGCAFAKMNPAGEIDAAAAPHLFLPRETAFEEKTLLNKVDNLLSKQGYAFIVCGEEIVDTNRIPLAKIYGANENEDPHGHTEHGRAGSFNYAEFIAKLIKNKLSVKTDSNYLKIKETPLTPQHIQRCLMRARVDAEEAFAIGRRAVAEFCDNDSKNINFSIGLKRTGDEYNIAPARIPLECVAGKVRQVDTKYLGTIDGPTEAFYKDFWPLVREELSKIKYVGPTLKNL